MAQQKKFDFAVKQDGEQWNAEITRRVSARNTSVSKRKKGFETEALATEWAKETLAGFLLPILSLMLLFQILFYVLKRLYCER